MAKAKGKVTFNEDVCKGCGLCVSVCPMNIITLDKNKLNAKGYHPATVVDMDKCIGCANCATMCPDVVITVERIDN
ncbi:2-oxoglutarate ferredoxin oxidoreductase subunit delta [Keratinibaculum paraultunense]|uniref:2-oxoglutarate ferredoxin oxidoreductase subunit delta n=1 Tax=Keratinibaculum paraultunense TaxID=1278232 RepID=A0A4R3KPN7_9FIRM|nr:4Fe-4S binding protein [Keratinibaculum paraultunense]QQY79341.1 4Fe-4S binding protein [Keratinibaculum paraultunense]TCS86640.1 2-oxoglutarate ferredoxin oxidoreductase subunit delta [Keratinibaculum paraultunense]